MLLDCEPTFWLCLPVASGNATENLGCRCLYNSLQAFWGKVVIHSSPWLSKEMMTTVGSHGSSSSLLFVMKVVVVVWIFVSNTHKGMNPLVLCCFQFVSLELTELWSFVVGIFSAISHWSANSLLASWAELPLTATRIRFASPKDCGLMSYTERRPATFYPFSQS